MKRIILSGYFNPLHGGHLDMIEEGAKMGDHLIVIVNNDAQQLIKKGKIILPQENRARLIEALRHVDEVVVSIDDEPPVTETLRMIADKYPNDELIFGNGGDRNSIEEIPEGEVAHEKNIKLVFGVGGTAKADSSTRINQALGHQK
jgi:cytidyltransferase-like protein